MKRPTEIDCSTKKAHKSLNEYSGYSVAKGDVVSVVDDRSKFRRYFIDARKPAKLTCSAFISIEKFRLDSIVEYLHFEDLLQVERKVSYGFGSGKTREHLSFSDIVDKLRKGDDSYYLTTQYEEDEEVRLDESDFSEEESDTLTFGNLKSRESQDLLGEHSEGSENEEAVARTEDEEESGENKSKLGSFAEKPITNSDSADGDSHVSSDDESIDFANLQDDFDDEEGDFQDDNSLEAHGEDMEFRVKSLYQPPLTSLVHDSSFPVTPKLFKNLIPQQINLWMGASKKQTQKPDLLNPTVEALGRYLPRGNSSGLHHDHADNLYVLVQGRKRFTLYSPKDAAKLYTVGNINKVYANGLIDYSVDEKARLWRPMREDGAIKAEWAKWALEQPDLCGNTKDHLEKIIDTEPVFDGEADESLDPPSFSRVPPILAHLDEISDATEKQALEELADREFPGFRGLHKLEVWLGPGDMLYIPTGWFHEVTSFASDKESAHIALNWWFMPPSGEINNPYADNYWLDDFEFTKKAIAEARKTA